MKFKIEIIYAKDKVYVKKLTVGEGTLLEYPLNIGNYHKYPSSTTIEKSILKPKFTKSTNNVMEMVYEIYKKRGVKSSLLFFYAEKMRGK